MAFLFNEDDIKKALIEAYEAGWRGCLEMKDEYAEKAMEALGELKMPEKHTPISWGDITISGSPIGAPSWISSSSGSSNSSNWATYIFSTDTNSGA